MSTNISAPLVDQAADAVAETRPVAGGWVETALTVIFIAVAVLFVSFVAVVSGIV
jgi:hypothetical protein